MNMYNWLQSVYFDNTVEHYLYFFIILLAGMVLRHFFSKQLSGLLYRFLKKHVAVVDVSHLHKLLQRPVGLFLFLITVYLACKQLHYPAEWKLESEERFGLRFILWKLFQVANVVALTWIVLRCIDFFGLVLIARARKTESRADDQLVPFVKESMKFLVIILSFFFMLGAIFNVNIASLIAGLGIGGIAIALAAKDTLENLLGSFTIFLDKPFTIGDLVKVGAVHGRVERIGFRSTLVRTLEKTIVTVPNKRMIDAELENISLRNMIRGLFPVIVRYDTAPAALEKFRGAVAEVLRNHPQILTHPESHVRIDRLSDYGIELQVLFFADTVDPDVFVVIREEILLQILKAAQECHVRLDVRAGERLVG